MRVEERVRVEEESDGRRGVREEGPGRCRMRKGREMYGLQLHADIRM